jgi:hypothetical protein
MVVAVAPVRVVEVIAHQVVKMIAVGHGFMTAAWTVNMAGLMARTGVLRRAGIRVLRGDLQRALVDVISVHGMQAAVVQIVHVAAVADGRVTAAFAVDVRVLRMDPMLRHGQTSVIPESRKEG